MPKIEALAAKTNIKAAVKGKIAEVVARPDVAADPTAIIPITEEVMKEVGPRIDKLTGNTNLLQSHTFWGLVTLILVRELARWGYMIPQEYHGEILNMLVTYGPYVAGAIVAYGKWVATKPMFSWLFPNK